ncbi:MAG TPA: hypothetical protein VLA56_02135 [Pseudomonadales bacterium]|nr:hypothetical protein [Pseudomonadales bacterium]
MITRTLPAIAAALILTACGGGTGGTGGTFTPPAVPASPPPPALGAQIDRMGRSAIATALISPLADDEARGMDRDAYNAAAAADWAGFTDNLRANLAIYDGLDTMCGNQVLADAAAAGPERYDTLAGALIDDRLYLNADAGACVQYLGVELDATGLVANTDCGGRTPLYDTIDVSYTALSNDLTIPVGDGVDMDNFAHSLEVFPFLATPTLKPDPPALGTQIDRIGRAAILTALISPLDDPAPRGVARDAYNSATPATWTDFTTNLRTSLAVFDGLDTICGNQLLADPTGTGPERYDTLAGALIDDRLYLRADSGACNQYLGVELDATGLSTNTDCGGRTPRHDTVDISYIALSNDLTIVIGDGVPSDDVIQSNSVFPFLASP